MRRGLLAVSALVVAAVVAVAVVLFVRRGDGHRPSVAASTPLAGTSTAARQTPNQTPTPAPVVAGARLAELATELTSSSYSDLARAIDPAVATAMRRAGQRPVPAGSRLRLDPATLTRIGQTSATVAATLTGAGTTSRFTLLLVNENGRWVVLSSTETR